MACEDDYGGDVVSLNEANAAAAERFRGPQGVRDGGAIDTLGDPDPKNPNPPVPTYPDGQGPTF